MGGVARGRPPRPEVLLDCSEGMTLADYNVARHILSRALARVYELDNAQGALDRSAPPGGFFIVGAPLEGLGGLVGMWVCGLAPPLLL